MASYVDCKDRCEAPRIVYRTGKTGCGPRQMMVAHPGSANSAYCSTTTEGWPKWAMPAGSEISAFCNGVNHYARFKRVCAIACDGKPGNQCASIRSRDDQTDTGLSGKYDFELTWPPEELVSQGGDEAGGPSLFAALQEQVGLKVEPKKSRAGLAGASGWRATVCCTGAAVGGFGLSRALPHPRNKFVGDPGRTR